MVCLFLLIFLPCAFSARILGVFLFPSYSHQKVFQPIWRDLSLRGHDVTVCTTTPLNDPNLTNLTEINISFQHDNTQHAPPDFLSKEINMFEDFHNIVNYMDFIAATALTHPSFKNFLETCAENFDLIILECLYPVLYGLSRKFQAPIACVSSLGALTVFQDVVGNPSHPTLYREFFVTLHHPDLDLWHQSELVLLNLWSRFWYEFVVLPRGAVLAKSVFGHEIGDTLDGEKSVKLFLLNVNRVVYHPRPNVPAVLELGQMGLKPKETLREDLQTFLDQAKSGVVYFSLGTLVHLEGSSIGRTILEGLARVPYKVIIKWNCSTLLHNYTNILCREWLPQTQILEHPNLKVFVTQGGLQSLEESISARVPLVALPFLVDQPMNVYKLVKQGIGKALNPVTVTPDELKDCVVEVAENRTYRDRVVEIRGVLLDKATVSTEKAIWWMEYIIRHKGAPHLRSLNVDISWFSYLLGDVIALFVVGLASTCLCFYYLLKLFNYNL
ncbi:hypothetical protein Zmor_028132 [Zophobas morio]|uniref:UDP-glucuronosyltransferase n=1 Tax=Zophobas morio TaxID=2755281 RepID=A0AA38HR70_9CUCU|nr:hypothetical protein Zmor_028132 [Zophobas morio]